MSSATSHLKSTASRVEDSKPLEYLARGGFVCFGVIHLLFAWLALQVAFGKSGQEGDQTGALQTLAGNGFGKVMLVVIAVGMVGLAAWQLFEAIVGDDEKPGKADVVQRAGHGLRTVMYLWLAWTAVNVLRGAGSSSAGKNQSKSSDLMTHTGGRWLVGLVGLVVLGVGIGLAVYGIMKKFEKHLHTERMSRSVKQTTVRVGQAGYAAKGAAYAIAGVLVVAAAVTYDPDKARGLDAALKTLAGQPYGPWLLGLIALGFAAFGVFCFSQAKYRKV